VNGESKLDAAGHFWHDVQVFERSFNFEESSQAGVAN